ncbi:MAG: HAMP domain-containing protein [Nitrospirae bacterium]|nr:MAG: HAMP domain-containing protein [Nitrospirota bacterium]
MTIVKKMYTGIGILTVVLVCLAVYFQISVRQTKADLEAIDKYREVQAGIAPMIVAHMKWAEGLAVGTILFGKEFAGQTDHTKCKFGEWYYSFTPPKEVEKTFREIEGPHKNLHATALKITAAMHAGKQDVAKKIYQEETVPALTEVQNKLNALRNEFKDTIVGRMTGGLKSAQDSMLRTSVIVYISVLAVLLTGFMLLLASPLKKSLLSIKKGINAMAAGDLKNNIEISSRDEIGDMAADLNGMAEKIRLMVSDADMLSRAAVEGKLRTRAAAANHEGDYRKIVEGMNKTMDSLVGFIDSMPIPAMIIDNGFGIQYMNNTGASILGRTPEQLVGEKCYNHFKTSDCNTDKCACGKAMRLGSASTGETDAHPSGMDLEIQYTGVPVKDMNGNIIGAFEVVVDQTAVKKAARIAKKVADYQEVETQKLKEALNKLSDGDLTFTIHEGDADADAAHVKQSFSEIAGAMNSTIETLRNLISQSNEAANQVSSAADQISDASQNFSQKITEQAAAVEETSATIEEMSASIKQTAENSREANKLAQGSKSLADSGSQVMGDTIKAMDEINKSSSKIANISNVIEEIAFQTNLLALNAAVEAARAGEHGKGFAVVASEIRSLAGRTTESAKEINSLIEDSVEKTGRGVQLAQELSRKLDEIGGSIRKVTDLMNEVAAAAQEQASGTSQVNTAMTQIDQTTQQNASLVEETSAAAEELAAQAKELLGVISFFRIEGERSVSGRQPANIKSIAGKGDRTLAGHQAASGLHTTRTIKHERLAADHKSPSMAAAGNRHNGHNNGFDEF